MGKFDLLNKFNSAVIVIDKNFNAVFRNNVFKRVFDDFETLDKFSHKLNYSVCALVSNDVEVHSPILQAMSSPWRVRTTNWLPVFLMTNAFNLFLPKD